ncbi:MAG: hypothetical protein AMQ22_01347 [Candidatus Methanofastidiosum methylothiophilum]|uniref:Uncharacterized protein n=1 Tax=Candidatus Methanofastidiosum methylothiophilum TaxID=1705564 RepID=A0A150J1V4_9EURY|nr:MAG: hypothetical protein AMQ22_01347 [Candidatus Methanofastidiosum methylthiophilus]
MNSRNDATVRRARSSTSFAGPASITSSLLTVSMVCSLRRLVSTRACRSWALSKTRQASRASVSLAAAFCSALGSSVLNSSFAFSSCASGSNASSRRLTTAESGRPPESASSRSRCSGVSARSSWARRPASDVSRSSSRLPSATSSSSLSNGTERARSSERVWVLSDSNTPTASTMTKRVLAAASGVTACSSFGSITRIPRPFIWSKYRLDLVSRRNTRHSSGRMSVPVEIMSTVTATRGL